MPVWKKLPRSIDPEMLDGIENDEDKDRIVAIISDIEGLASELKQILRNNGISDFEDEDG